MSTPTDADRLAAAAVELLSTISATNLRNGNTYAVSLSRTRIEALAAEVERQYPGWIAYEQAKRDAP